MQRHDILTGNGPRSSSFLVFGCCGGVGDDDGDDSVVAGVCVGVGETLFERCNPGWSYAKTTFVHIQDILVY